MSSSPLHVVVVGLDVDADGPPEKPWSRDGASCSPTFWIGASKRLQWEHDPDKFGIRSSALSCRTCCWAAPSVAGSLTMAVREPDASGAGSVGSVGGDEQKRAVPNDHPVLVAFRNARMVDEPVPEVERVAVEEWMASPEGVDGEVVAAMLAERAAREG